MKKMMYLAIAASLLFACNNAPETPKAETEAPAAASQPDIKKASLASTKCLPCGDMELEEGAIADTLTVDGKTYGFCSSECKEAFATDPQKYLTQN